MHFLVKYIPSFVFLFHIGVICDFWHHRATSEITYFPQKTLTCGRYVVAFVCGSIINSNGTGLINLKRKIVLYPRGPRN